MSSSNSFAAVSNSYIDSLISYVLDVKPYHTKLSAAVESYLFEDTVNVKMVENDQWTAFVGPDDLPSSFTELGVRLRRSQSWYKDIISNGQTRTYQVPPLSMYRYSSDTGQDTFVVGQNEYTGIPGLPNTISRSGVYNQKRWDGPGIAALTKNGTPLTESIDYFLSHGVFSFNTYGDGTWKSADVDFGNISSQFANQPGLLAYDDITTTFGVVKNISSNTTPDEWTISCIDNGSGGSEIRVNGVLHPINALVTNPNHFTSDEISFDLLDNAMSIGDSFVLTPSAQITVNPANAETWSLIKVNPIASNGASYLVYGSNSGWSAPATVGKWYWNGNIGFKIPSLSYFAVAEVSTISISTTAEIATWNTVVSNNQLMKAVSFQNGVFFAVGENSIVGASLDGYNWTSNIPSIFTPAAGELIMITGDAGYLVTSTDGNTWVKQTTNTTQTLNGATYVPDFVKNYPGYSPALLPSIIAVGNGGTILTSVTGQGWAQQISGTTADLKDIVVVPPTPEEVAHGVTHAVVTVGSGGTILRSRNRLKWVKKTSHTTSNLNAVINVNGILTAVGDDGVILRSIDSGRTWSNLGAFTSGSLTSITYNGATGRYIAVGPDGWVASSADGIVWTRYSGTVYNSVAYGNGVVVAVGGKTDNLQQFVPLNLSGPTLESDSPVPSPLAIPSVYTVTFTSPTTATVYNNIDGFLGGLSPYVNNPGSPWSNSTPQDWTDGKVAFRIESIPGLVEYSAGDIINIYVAAFDNYNGMFKGYDEFGLEVTLYDSFADQPGIYHTESFPLFHSNGAVIVNGVNPGDVLKIEKAYADNLRMQILGATAAFPELGAIDDWIPLEFKFYEGVAQTQVETFSDLVTKIEAYAVGNETTTGPLQLVFSISQPQYLATNSYQAALLTIDPAFFAKYLKFNTKFSFWFMQTDSYGQTIRVKISEKIAVFHRITITLSDIFSVNISEHDISTIEIVENMEFIDAVNIVFLENSFNDTPIFYISEDVQLLKIDQSTGLPYVAGYDEDLYDAELGSNSNLVDAIYDATNPNYDSAPASIQEGLTIQMIEAADTTKNVTTVVFDASVYSTKGNIKPDPVTGYPTSSTLTVQQQSPNYIITLQNSVPIARTPTIIIQSVGSSTIEMPATSLTPYDQDPTFVSLSSFSFSLPAGVTAPFNLWLVNY